MAAEVLAGATGVVIGIEVAGAVSLTTAVSFVSAAFLAAFLAARRSFYFLRLNRALDASKKLSMLSLISRRERRNLGLIDVKNASAS